MRIVELLLFAIVFWINFSQEKRCGRLFPIALGSKNYGNYGNQLDYHSATGQLAVAFDTLDELFAGSSTIFYDYRGGIALLKEPAMEIIWIKTVSIICYLQGVTFSADGQLVLGHTHAATYPYIFIFNALDGTLKKSFSYALSSNSYPLYTRNILFGSPVSSTYTGFAHTMRFDSSGSIFGFQTFSFAFTSTSTLSIVWQKLTYYSGENPYAIVFSHTESFLYAFSQMKSTDYVLARLNAANGAIVWQYYFIPTTTFSEAIVSSTLARKTLADGLNEVIIAHRGSGIQRPIFVRIVADFTTGTVSTIIPPTTYIHTTSAIPLGMRAHGQFIIDQDQTAFLMVKDSQTYFALLNFGTLTVSYKRALPILDTDYLGMSVMKSDTMFYAITQGARVGVSSTTATWQSFATFQPIVLSSDIDESCYTVYTETYTSYALSKSVAITSLSKYNYFSNTAYTGVTLTPSTTITTYSYVIAHMQSLESWCPLYKTPYAIESVTQAQTTFSYTAGSSATFSITPYQSKFNCGSVAPVFTYTGFLNSNGVALVPADFIQVASIDGKITVTIAGTITSTGIKIEGVLQDLTYKWQQVFTLVGNPPILPNLATAPLNQIIPVFKVSTMNIGTINPFAGRPPSTSVQIAGGGTPPAFITYSDPIVTFNSPGYAQLGVYKLEIKVWDSVNSQTYPFELTVKNDPPVFIQPAPLRIEAILGVNTLYPFPNFQDPESQPCSVSIVSAPSFVSISGIQQLNIYSTNISDVMEHDVTIKIEDTQPLGTSYSFKLAILIRAPELTGALENKTVQFNSVLTYVLPVTNPHNQPLVLTMKASQIVENFTTISSTSLQFTPILKNHIGTFEIQVKISDSFAQLVQGSFWLTVLYKAPYFVSAKPLNQVISINQETLYMFPLFACMNSDPLIILTSQPTFVKFSDQLLTFLPSAQDLGKHIVEGYLSDGIEQTPFSFVITVINKAPVFETKLSNIQVKVMVNAKFSLPKIIDEDSHSVIVSPSFAGDTKLPSFVSYDNQQKDFQIYPVTNKEAGTYLISVTLTDSLKASSVSSFLIEVNQTLNQETIRQQVFTGKLSDIKLADVIVDVSSTGDTPVKIELPSQFFSSENLKAAVNLKQTQGFLTFRNGVLYSRAKQKDIGIYTETVAVSLNGDPTQTRNVPFMIRVLPKSRNTTCPFGSRPDDCLPKIESITDSGLLTVFFPIPLSTVVNETQYKNLSGTLDIKLVQQVQANTSISSWDVVRLTTTQLELQLFITNPLYVSFLSEELDKVTVVMLDPTRYLLVENSAYLIKDNYTMTDSIPPQKLNSTLMRTVQKTFSILDSGMTSGLMVNLVLAMVISAPMKLMWGVINTMQIITYMTWMNMKMPQNVVVCLNTIHDISNLSIIPKDLTDKVLQVIAGLKKKVVGTGQEDPDMTVKKIMQIAIIFVAAAIGVVFLALLYFLQKRFSMITKVYVLLRDKLMWGVFITFFIKSYLKLFVSSALGVQEENKTQTERLVPFIMLLVLSIAPFFMLTGLVNIRDSFDNSEVKRKYGALTLNLRTDSPPAYLYNWFYVIRRMIYGLSLAFLGSNPSTQVSIQIILSLGNLLYVQQQLPYFERWDNYLELCNELTILLFFTTSVSYADRSPSPEAASDWGFLQIGLLACNLAFNLSIFIYTLGKLLITKILDYMRRARQQSVSSAQQLKTVKIQKQLHSQPPSMFPPSLSLDELNATNFTKHPHSVFYQDHQNEQHEESKNDWAGIKEEEAQYYEDQKDIQNIGKQGFKGSNKQHHRFDVTADNKAINLFGAQKPTASQNKQQDPEESASDWGRDEHEEDEYEESVWDEDDEEGQADEAAGEDYGERRHTVSGQAKALIRNDIINNT